MEAVTACQAKGRQPVIRRSFLAIIPLSVAFVGCGMQVSVTQARNESLRLNDYLAKGLVSAAYGQASQDFKDAVPLSSFEKYFANVVGDLGAFGPVEEESYNVQAGTGGLVVTIVFRVKCAKGDAIETLSWRDSQGQMKFVSLDISPAERSSEEGPGPNRKL